MMKEWRNRLFESPNPETGLYLLELPLSVAEGTRILGICYRTWKRWHELAMSVPEYKQHHIEMLEKLSDANSAPPIVRYQVWVTGKIGEIFTLLPHGIAKKWIVQDCLQKTLKEFTIERYQREQSQFTKSEQVHRVPVHEKGV
ncbi:hypothetical protein LC605_25920 [Nostoc sp. CHAB 5836]|uniref:hypothetical protein n=1 Tax=Nostoc sp. CHAB 5836 TaxID=2780404 RepID=UPI001E63AAD6|nr:hypothetical protein [Nostoc sp. CHAB 5836]MCC5618461.1 hypothetical protein [Nostoc sp. CHAB 5836]